MASISNLFKFHPKSFNPSKNPQTPFLPTKVLFHPNHHFYTSKTIFCCSLSSSSPPKSREEAISQAKTCISTTLVKTFNKPKLAGKMKKQKQPRFRIEIPVTNDDDDSLDSVSELAFDVFQNVPIKNKCSIFNLVMFWPNLESTQSALQTFESNSLNQIQHFYISSEQKLDEKNRAFLNSADAAVFMAVKASQLAVMKQITEDLSPKPVLLFNPNWGFDEEKQFGEILKNFVESFQVIYSFMGLEVRGFFSIRKGLVYKSVTSEKWNVYVEEDDGEMKIVSGFKTRPPISEVEYVLYNLMAINSPITKSAKFLKNLAANVTGKKFWWMQRKPSLHRRVT